MTVRDVETLLRLAQEARKLELSNPGAPKPGPNYKQVSPEAKHRLRGILRHYAKEPHPFRACVRDNRKRFGPRTEAVCAVVKDIIRDRTDWRGKNNPKDHGAPGVVGLSEDKLVLTLEEADILASMTVAELTEWLAND
jgi:hypothetical protein